MALLTNENRLLIAIQVLPKSIYKIILPTFEKICNSAQEIRLRINRPIAIVCKNITYFISLNGELVSNYVTECMQKNLFIVNKSDMLECFNNICSYSVYAKQNEISNGFVTMRGGHRVGICGTAISDGKKIINVRDISSINIRIAREHKDCSKPIFEMLNNNCNGLLICGSPCSGKTTILRDIARILSTEFCKRISIIDERGEIAGASSGIIQNDVGLSDVFDMYEKSNGIIQAIRSMSPDIIICDEIGSLSDVDAVEYSINSGVAFITTIHCANEFELKNKPIIKRLINCGGFENIVFLENRSKVGQVKKILKVGEIFDV